MTTDSDGGRRPFTGRPSALQSRLRNAGAAAGGRRRSLRCAGNVRLPSAAGSAGSIPAPPVRNIPARSLRHIRRSMSTDAIRQSRRSFEAFSNQHENDKAAPARRTARGGGSFAYQIIFFPEINAESSCQSHHRSWLCLLRKASQAFRQAEIPSPHIPYLSRPRGAYPPIRQGR